MIPPYTIDFLIRDLQYKLIHRYIVFTRHPQSFITSTQTLFTRRLKYTLSTGLSLRRYPRHQTLPLFRIYILLISHPISDCRLVYLVEVVSQPATPLRRRASKPMAQTGPSGDGRNSSDGIERPTNSEKGLALAGYSYLSNEERTWVFVAYHRFRYRGRALDYEEIYGMATMVMGKEAIPSSTLHFLLTRFDNPQDSLTKEHEEEARKSEQSFLAEVDADFTRYLQNDEEAEDRCRNLEGL